MKMLDPASVQTRLSADLALYDLVAMRTLDLVQRFVITKKFVKVKVTHTHNAPYVESKAQIRQSQQTLVPVCRPRKHSRLGVPR